MLRPYTLNLDDSLMHAAKMRAVQEKTSVSEIVRRLLSGYLGVADPRPPRIEAAGIVEVLSRYSRGDLQRSQAMRALGLDIADLGRFNALMGEFEIAWPAPDGGRASHQASIVAEIISREGGAAR
jgi:hypothetical protein